MARRKQWTWAELAGERRRLGVRQADLTKALGMSRPLISIRENLGDVVAPENEAAKYLDAVEAAAKGTPADR